MEDINPKNRGKTKFYFFIRKIEDLIKNFFLLIIVLFSFFFKIRSKERKSIDLQDYVDNYAINYIVFSLSKKFIFYCNIRYCLPLIKRLGIKTFLLNCKINFFSKKKSLKVFYNKKNTLKNESINFNFDYFKPFDENNFNEIKSTKTIILPYYARSKFYQKNLFTTFEKIKSTNRTIPIIFSGSNHTDWYDQFKWQINQNTKERILTRCEILNFVKNEFKNETQIISNREQLNKIDKEKKIIFFISDPSKKRKLSKLLSIEEHINFISRAKFFLTCPGTAMPLCHHMIESIFLGTVPISSYGNLLYPKLENNKNSLLFYNYTDLYDCIKKALVVRDDEYNNMRNATLNYYKVNLSPASFLNNFQSLEFPVNMFMNVDGHTLDSRRERFGLPRLFPKPNSKNNIF